MRTIDQRPEFLAQLTDIEPDYQRIDEFLTAFDWVLCRKPEIGVRVKESPPIWMLQSVQSKTLPPLHVYYTFNETKVFLIGIRRV